jgi:uncharacterized membrane protein YbhN (UPF0104 family)
LTQTDLTNPPAEPAPEPPEAKRPPLRLFAVGAAQPTVRRATDVMLLVPALLALAALIASQPSSGIEESLKDLIATLPGWLDGLWGLTYDLLALIAICLFVAALVTRRTRLAVHALLAAVLAVAIALVASRIGIGRWPDIADYITGGPNTSHFPAVRVGWTSALLATMLPDLARPMRRAATWSLLAGALGATLLGVASPTGIAAGLLIALITAAGVRLVFGTAAGRPTVDDVRGFLAEFGVAVTRLEPALRQDEGVFTLDAVGAGDRRLRVKVYGRDAYDNQLLQKVWRTLWYRDGGPALELRSKEGAEHEGFMTLLAANADVPTERVVTAGMTASDDSILVLETRGATLATAGDVDDTVLASAWQALSRLHAQHIAHLRIDPNTILVTADGVLLADLGSASVAPSPDQLVTDQSQLLAASAAATGIDRAIESADRAIGRDALGALLPYLQTAAFPTGLRVAMKESAIDVDDLRTSAAKRSGVEQPKLARLRRVTVGTVVQLALLVLAAAAIIAAFGNVDFAELRTDLEDASWGWAAVGLLAAQLTRPLQAASTRATVPARLAFGPVYAMQLAIGFMNVALPSSIARMAVNIRFFQRQGISPPVAITAGAIDSFAGNVVQILLLVLLLVFTPYDINLALDAPSGDSGGNTILSILVVVLVASIATVLLVPRFRNAGLQRIRAWWPEVRAAIGSLSNSSRLLVIVFANVGAELLFAGALGLFARCLGYELPLAQLLVINLSVSLFASLIPVPGGIGVTEGALMVGLAAAGLPDSTALAVTMLFRFSTFYLPPIWGWVAMRWLQRHQYL